VAISDSCNYMSGKRAAANQHWGRDNGTTICAWSDSREVSSLGFRLESRALLKGSGFDDLLGLAARKGSESHCKADAVLDAEE
jgi:hypothetical protein